MSKTKSYNQIIFITTLSVYLGLVLVGASPQVLAQAALTNKFELKDQIEQKDDLDKKPDDEINEFLEIDLDKAISQFIEDVRNVKDKNPNPIAYNSAYTFCEENSASSLMPPFQKSSWENALGDLHFKLYLPNRKSFVDSLNFIDYSEKGCKETSLRTEFNKSELTINLKFSKKNPTSFVEKIKTIYQQKSVQSSKNVSYLVYQNTTINSADNQVFIVTRLPRGSIDSLLK
jgi:hypothetical protein